MSRLRFGVPNRRPLCPSHGSGSPSESGSGSALVTLHPHAFPHLCRSMHPTDQKLRTCGGEPAGPPEPRSRGSPGDPCCLRRPGPYRTCEAARPENCAMRAVRQGPAGREIENARGRPPDRVAALGRFRSPGRQGLDVRHASRNSQDAPPHRFGTGRGAAGSRGRQDSRGFEAPAAPQVRRRRFVASGRSDAWIDTDAGMHGDAA